MSWICRRPNNCREFFPIFAKSFVPNADFIMEFAIRALRTTTQVDVLKKTFALGFGMLRNSTPWGKCSINVAKQRILLVFYKFHTYLLIFIDLSICHEKYIDTTRIHTLRDVKSCLSFPTSPCVTDKVRKEGQGCLQRLGV